MVFWPKTRQTWHFGKITAFDENHNLRDYHVSMIFYCPYWCTSQSLRLVAHGGQSAGSWRGGLLRATTAGVNAEAESMSTLTAHTGINSPTTSSKISDNTQNSVCSWWISTKYRTLHYLNMTSCHIPGILWPRLSVWCYCDIKVRISNTNDNQ